MNSQTPVKLKVSPSENGITLIQFLADRLGVSRNKAKEIIDRRRVFINGKRTWMARHCLKPGDQIAGAFTAGKSAEIKRAIVLYEDDDYLIVNKPSGLPSNGPDSIEQFLNRQSGNESTAACHASRVACHRLDKDTSGCLIFAKRQKAKERIIPLFIKKEIIKEYEAIIRGCLPKAIMTITAPIDGQKAVSRVRLLDATPAASPAGSGASHVSISIETGRTHQIRKHLASIGHPVLGDQHYGVGREVPQSERLIGRQMLHAVGIKFIQPFTGKPVHCESPLPADMKECLRQYHLK
ncbi:MAG: RluA family pseudouridine synthase [Kiritimatiellia bacterium]|nr:RluA family pseudouridine synthase [Kiritimatiellia bacterium]